MIVFDLDGTLLDTRETIITAYGLAGVTVSDDILERAATGWLENQVGAATAETIRAKKNEEYLRMLRTEYRPMLPPMQAAIQLHQAGYGVGIMTGAPTGSLAMFQLQCREQCRIWPFDAAIEATATPEKMERLPQLDDHGVYIDDQDRLINMPDGWHFIHYIGQPPGTLYKEIVTCGCA